MQIEHEAVTIIVFSDDQLESCINNEAFALNSLKLNGC